VQAIKVMLYSEDLVQVDQVTWLLGNLTDSGMPYCKMLLEQCGIVKRLYDLCMMSGLPFPIFSSMIWILQNLSRLDNDKKARTELLDSATRRLVTLIATSALSD
jgi:hypothetical protein